MIELGQVTDAMPPEVARLVKYLIEGRVKQLIVIAELDDGTVLDGMKIIEGDANRYVMVGALESAKRDYMRANIQARIEYEEADPDE